MTLPRVESIGMATLYLGDCRDIMSTLARPDAICSDPPYGQSQNTNVRGAGGLRALTPPGCGARAIAAVQRHRNTAGRNTRTKGTAGNLHRTGFAVEWPEGIAGDDEPFDPAPLIAAAPRVLLWGAHRFHERLPLGTWLVWDKVPTGKVRDQGDGEAAWINDSPARPMRIYRLLWDGVCVGSAARHEVTAGRKRVHPTQKPEALMSWCLEQLRLQPSSTILDPYMGAGSTGVAALRAGHRFVGIEKELLYFDTACRRVEEAQRQGDMFIEGGRI